MVVPAAGGVPKTWATLPVATSGERGLLGLAVHPDFPDSPYVYVFHTNPSPLENRIVRMVDSAGVGTRAIVFFGAMPAGATNHHGGRLAFGPDGMLWATYGDQETRANARFVDELPGKILRLGRGGHAAPANPFGSLNPVAVYGVRNPFGLAFDPLDGTGYFTENGPECDDEINVLMIGADYGWGPGDFCDGQPGDAVPAVATFTPTIAPTGACVYRGPLYGGWLDGDLLFGSFNDQGLMRIRFAPGSVTEADTIETLTADGDAVYDVTTGPFGYIHFSTFRNATNSNEIRRIVPPVAVSVDRPAAPPVIQAAPNPFRQTITLGLPGWGRGRIEVLDAGGRRVRSWSDPPLGRVVWDGRDERGVDVPAGVYFARISGPAGAASRIIVRLGR
jgi:glucose/arabinose dehydrogenase